MILSAKIQNIPDSPNVFAQNVPDSPNVFAQNIPDSPNVFTQNIPDSPNVWSEEKYTEKKNTSRPSLGSQMKDFGTKTHFFSKKK